MSIKNNYNKNGFVVEKGLIPLSQIKKLLGNINELLLLQLRFYNIQGTNSVPKNLKILFDSDVEKYKCIIGSL